MILVGAEKARTLLEIYRLQRLNFSTLLGIELIYINELGHSLILYYGKEFVFSLLMY